MPKVYKSGCEKATGLDEMEFPEYLFVKAHDAPCFALGEHERALVGDAVPHFVRLPGALDAREIGGFDGLEPLAEVFSTEPHAAHEIVEHVVGLKHGELPVGRVRRIDALLYHDPTVVLRGFLGRHGDDAPEFRFFFAPKLVEAYRRVDDDRDEEDGEYGKDAFEREEEGRDAGGPFLGPAGERAAEYVVIERPIEPAEKFVDLKKEVIYVQKPGFERFFELHRCFLEVYPAPILPPTYAGHAE